MNSANQNIGNKSKPISGLRANHGNEYGSTSHLVIPCDNLIHYAFSKIIIFVPLKTIKPC